MKMVDNVGIVWHRLWSVRMAVIGVLYAAAGSVWLLLPADWKPDLSESVRWVLVTVGVSLAAAPGLASVVKQPKLAETVTAKTGTATITVPAPLPDNAEHA